MKNYKFLIAVVFVVSVMGLAYTLNKADTNLELHQLDIKTKSAEINTLNEQIDDYNQNEVKDQKELDSLKEENERLQTELQAKLDKQAEDARNVVYAASQPKAPTVAPSGSCKDWMVQAGIASGDMASAYALIMRESGCNPAVFNPTSSAGGIPQALPFSKMGCSTSDPVCQIVWMQGYVNARYGGFPQANAFQLANNWY